VGTRSHQQRKDTGEKSFTVTKKREENATFCQ